MINAQNSTVNTSTDKSTPIVSTTIAKNNDSFVSMNINHQPLSTLLCEKRDKPYFLPHKSEASKFYVCVKGQLFLLNCPSGYRFDSDADQCVRKTIKDEKEESKLFISKQSSIYLYWLHLTEPKKPVLIPHETNCGWYYVVRVETTDERVLNSCPMPQLFDIPTRECKNYTEVKCKDRFEPKDACKFQNWFYSKTKNFVF
jgi:hypothetical protein